MRTARVQTIFRGKYNLFTYLHKLPWRHITRFVFVDVPSLPFFLGGRVRLHVGYTLRWKTAMIKRFFWIILLDHLYLRQLQEGHRKLAECLCFTRFGQLSSSLIVKLSEAYPSWLHQWTDYLKLEPASRFKNAIMNWLFEYWTRSLYPGKRLTGSVFEKSIHCCD